MEQTAAGDSEPVSGVSSPVEIKKDRIKRDVNDVDSISDCFTILLQSKGHEANWQETASVGGPVNTFMLDLVSDHESKLRGS